MDTQRSEDYVNGVKRIFDWDDYRITLNFGQRWNEGGRGGEKQMWIDVKPITSKPSSSFEVGLSNKRLGNLKINDHKLVFAYSTAHDIGRKAIDNHRNADSIARPADPLWPLLQWLRKSEVQERIQAEMEAGLEEYDADQGLPSGGNVIVPPKSGTSHSGPGSSIETADPESASGAMGSGRTGKNDVASTGKGVCSILSQQTQQGVRKRSASVDSNASTASDESFVSATSGTVQD